MNSENKKSIFLFIYSIALFFGLVLFFQLFSFNCDLVSLMADGATSTAHTWALVIGILTALIILATIVFTVLSFILEKEIFKYLAWLFQIITVGFIVLMFIINFFAVGYRLSNLTYYLAEGFAYFGLIAAFNTFYFKNYKKASDSDEQKKVVKAKPKNTETKAESEKAE